MKKIIFFLIMATCVGIAFFTSNMDLFYRICALSVVVGFVAAAFKFSIDKNK